MTVPSNIRGYSGTYVLFESALRTGQLSPMSLPLLVRRWVGWDLHLLLTVAIASVLQCPLVHSGRG